uniref:F-box protein 48 n=1 Tax=Gouania willdenowi TaxID=441366 RepID=A0A8C5D9D9_GOUWI
MGQSYSTTGSHLGFSAIPTALQHIDRYRTGLNPQPLLPVELSVRIFLVLDPLSLLTAAQSCSLWNRTINHSWNIWKHHCCSLCCRTHVDKDRQDGYSWKNFHRSVLKRDWLSGRYSDVSSADELRDVTMISLDAESWGEILQAELDR